MKKVTLELDDHLFEYFLKLKNKMKTDIDMNSSVETIITDELNLLFGKRG